MYFNRVHVKGASCPLLGTSLTKSQNDGGWVVILILSVLLCGILFTSFIPVLYNGEALLNRSY